MRLHLFAQIGIVTGRSQQVQQTSQRAHGEFLWNFWLVASNF
jgi:hypothetical protein